MKPSVMLFVLDRIADLDLAKILFCDKAGNLHPVGVDDGGQNRRRIIDDRALADRERSDHAILRRPQHKAARGGGRRAVQRRQTVVGAILLGRGLDIG